MQHVTIKRGGNGASHYQWLEGALHEQHVAGYQTPLVDPTGAGDCFGATFVSLLLAGYPVGEALTYANASGALAVSRKGPMEGISTLQEIKRLVLA